MSNLHARLFHSLFITMMNSIIHNKDTDNIRTKKNEKKKIFMQSYSPLHQRKKKSKKKKIGTFFDANEVATHIAYNAVRFSARIQI